MRIVIKNLVTAECELTGKNTECVEVCLDESRKQPPAIIAAGELLKLIRFTKTQEQKQETADK